MKLSRFKVGGINVTHPQADLSDASNPVTDTVDFVPYQFLIAAKIKENQDLDQMWLDIEEKLSKIE